MDEVRYGRACLLLLNVCPFTLRKVIDDYYTQRGSPNFTNFLENHKHKLFHLLYKHCCCRSIPNNITPMNESQIVLLYIKNSLSCKKGKRGDCPCQYDAKPGVKTDVMDVTLCCLVIKNICQGINLSHIDTIRDIRNKLIHAASAYLDEHTYFDFWNRVKTAILDLANNVSRDIYIDTLDKVHEIENRLMSSDEMEEMRNRLEDLETRLSVIENGHQETNRGNANVNASNEQANEEILYTRERVTDVEESLNQSTHRLTQVEGNIPNNIETINERENEEILYTRERIIDCEECVNQPTNRCAQVEENVNNLRHSVSQTSNLPHTAGEVSDVETLRRRLYEINYDITKSIPIPRLNEHRGGEISIDLLYGQIIIREDKTHREDGDRRRRFQNTKNVIDPAKVFIMDDKVAKRIFMLGDAARGKTTFCVWLLNNWCKVHQKGDTHEETLNAMERALLEYDFVFLLKFGYMNQNRYSVIDMICNDIFASDIDCHRAIRDVLSSNKYRSLIIVDSLNEMNTNEELVRPGIPNIEGVSSTVTCLFSIRPWMFLNVSEILRYSDKVIEITGLSRNGVNTIVKKILKNHFELNEESDIEMKSADIMRELRQRNLKSLVKIPLLAIIYVLNWYRGNRGWDSLARFYVDMLNLLIKRSYENQSLRFEQNRTVEFIIPEILSEHRIVRNSICDLLNVGKIAFESLLARKSSLEFQKRILDDQISDEELHFAQQVGLISRRKAPGHEIHNISVHFFHEFIRELLAAIYIVTVNDAQILFCERLNTVPVLKLANVIRLICGMCSRLSIKITHHIARAIEQNMSVFDFSKLSQSTIGELKELYNQEIIWYRELQYGHAASLLKFQVAVVFLDWKSDIDIIRISRTLMSDPQVEIRSLVLDTAPYSEVNGVSYEDLDGFLSSSTRTRSLVVLSIIADFERYINTIHGPNLRTLYLNFCKVKDTQSYHPLLIGTISICKIEIREMDMGNRSLGLSAEMTNIRSINLNGVSMSAAAWGHLVESLSTIQHRFDVKIVSFDIDDISQNRIRSSEDFQVIDDVETRIRFSRRWPLETRNRQAQNPTTSKICSIM